MPNYSKKISIFLLAIFLLIAIFFSFAQASFWDVIRALVTINPLSIDVSAPAEVEIDKVFKIKAEIENKGEEKIENAKGEIFLPSGLVLLKKDTVQRIGVISNKKVKKISWSVKGEEIGNYIISVKVSGELREDLIEAQDSTMFEVKESFPKRNFWQRFFDIFRKWF